MSSASSPAQSEGAQRTLVIKFGGTSVGSIDAMRQVVQIVRETTTTWPRLVVVTSALNNVTNQLLNSATSAVECETHIFHQAADDLRIRHLQMAETLVQDPALLLLVKREVKSLVDEFLNLCQAISVLGEANPRAMDAVASLGERMSVQLLAAAINSAGLSAEAVESTQLIVTDDQFTDAHPDMAATREKVRQILLPVLAKGSIVVTTGFIAATSKGTTTTLGRGGSDYTAAILGAAIPANEVWIYTDVNGVMTADPRLVPQAFTLPELSYREVAELSYYGAKVLHPKTIRPVIEAGIGLRVCNTFNPTNPGTRIVSDNAVSRHNGVIKAITAIRGLQLVNLEGRGMLGVPGVAARTFQAVATVGASVPLITQASSEQSICFAVPCEQTEKVLAALRQAFAHEIEDRDIDGVNATDEIGIISVVGTGMIHTHGVAGRVFGTLGENGVNVIAIAQGSSEVSISLVVDVQSVQKAVSALHTLIEKVSD